MFRSKVSVRRVVYENGRYTILLTFLLLLLLLFRDVPYIPILRLVSEDQHLYWVPCLYLLPDSVCPEARDHMGKRHPTCGHNLYVTNALLCSYSCKFKTNVNDLHRLCCTHGW